MKENLVTVNLNKGTKFQIKIKENVFISINGYLTVTIFWNSDFLEVEFILK